MLIVMKFFLIILFSAFSCNLASAQPKVRDRKPTSKELAQLNAYSERDSINGTFEHLKLEGKTYRGRIERIIIPRGDSTRIKYVFDNTYVIRIAVEGGGETTPLDIRKGIFVTSVSPEKTKMVNVLLSRTILAERIGGQDMVVDKKLQFRVIVVEPEKYDSIMDEYNKIKDSKKRTAFLDKLAGGSWQDFAKGKIK